MNHQRDRHWPGVSHSGAKAVFSNWPGQAGSAPERSVAEPWIPTGFGPGEGPDPGDSCLEQGRLTDSELSARSEILCRYEIESTRETSEARQAGRILQNRIDQLCPSCGYAKLRIDAELHISCPICRFGVHRQPEL